MEITPDEAIRKAALVEETISTEGWKIIMDIMQSLLEKEVMSLMTVGLDANYYRKIGMIQSLHYIKHLEHLVKDIETREFLLHQGRAVGFDALRKAPQVMFEGRQKGQEIMNKIHGGNNLDLGKDKKEFLDQTYRQS